MKRPARAGWEQGPARPEAAAAVAVAATAATIQYKLYNAWTRPGKPGWKRERRGEERRGTGRGRGRGRDGRRGDSGGNDGALLPGQDNEFLLKHWRRSETNVSHVVSVESKQLTSK